ncbi:MAG: DUF1552 domain-containing protein [Sandaracinaceae bacterium]
MTRKLKLGRRLFLGAAGAAAAAGTSLLSPYRSRVAADDGCPRRFVFFLSGNGFDASVLFSDGTRSFIEASRGNPVQEHLWWGEGYNDDVGYSEAHQSTETISGLSTASALTSLGELESQACVVLGLSQPGTGSHSAHHGVLSGTRTIGGRDPGGQTLDSYLASLSNVRGAGDRTTPLSAIRVGVHGGSSASVTYDSCAAGPNRPLPSINDPAVAWDAYLSPLVSADGVAALARRTRLLEFARNDAERAVARMPGGRPQAQAQAYLAATQELLENQARFERVIGSSSGLALPDRPGADLLPLDAMRAQMAMVGGALRAGVTNVAVVGMGTGGGFHSFRYQVGPNTSSERHGLCHEFSDGGAQEIRNELRDVWHQEIGSVLDLARELAATPEPGQSGSMLDYTVIAYLADNGVGHHSRPWEHPTLLLGGGALGLNTGGRTVVFPDQSSPDHRQLVNLWDTLRGPIAGQDLPERADFGDPRSRLTLGPLPELLG